MPILINPNQLTSTDTKELFVFLERQRQIGVRIWKKDTIYTFNNVEYEFSHDLIQRERTKNKTGFRYEFISDRLLGGGAFGKVFDVEGTLAINESKLKFKPYGYKGKRRAVKIQVPIPQIENQEGNKRRVKQEYHLAQKAGHLGIKKPTFDGGTSYTVMKKLYGKELFQILKEDLDGSVKLSLQQRIDLTKALVKALKEQVIDRGIIHRDIKGENILVALGDPISINIYDYGLSIEAGKSDLKSVGSRMYSPPEAYAGVGPTFAWDIFSIGRVLALLWHPDMYEFNLAEKICNATRLNLDLLFLNLNLEGLSEANQAIIKNTIKAMLAVDRTKRPSIDEVIAEFGKIHLAHNQPRPLMPVIPVVRNDSEQSSDNSNSRDNSDHAHTILSKQQVAAYIQSSARLAAVLRQIKALRAKAAELNDRKESSASKVMSSLATNLEGELQNLQAMDPEDYNRHIHGCIEKCQGFIMQSRPELKTHRNSNYIIANIALGIAGLGVFYAVALLINKAITGRNAFFAQTESRQLTTAIEKNLVRTARVGG